MSLKAMSDEPEEPAETDQSDDADGQIKSALERETKYQTALKAAEDAYGRNEFKLAYDKAVEAENYRPGEANATELQDEADEQIEFERAQTLKDEGEYKRAEAACAAHGGVDRFKNLAGRIRTEKEEYDKDNNQFISGNYSFIDSLNRLGYSVKKPFTELLTKAVREKGILGELETFKQATNWMAVI